MADWLTRWTKAKAPLKKFTSTSKPNKAIVAKVMALSAIETALSAAEKAVTNSDESGIKKAYQDYVKAASVFAGVLTGLVEKLSKSQDQTDQTDYMQIASEMVNILDVQEKTRKEIMEEVKKVKQSGQCKLEVTTYGADWQGAKKHFESATGKKKPSASLALFFRKPAGLDKAFAAFDTATRKNDAAAVIKAGVLVEKAAADYVKTLKNVLKESKEAEDYKTAVKALEANIQTILNRLRLTVKSAQGG